MSFVASVPMSDAVMNRLPTKKKTLSLAFLMGWITLGVVSALDVNTQLKASNPMAWTLCLLGPLTVILSQKILFESRKMGTLWEEQGKPNFRPVVYNMGGPLFVWGWFYFWMGSCGVPALMNTASPYAGLPKTVLPLFFNWRTIVAFAGETNLTISSKNCLLTHLLLPQAGVLWCRW